MLLTLLLQAVTSKTVTVAEGILPAVYGTLIAAILSLVASIYATVTASKTQKKVADLQVRANQALKDKDYNNDFYKKVIENRLVAYKMVGDLLALLTPDNEHPKNNNPLYLVVFWVTLDYFIDIRNRDIDEQYDKEKELCGKRDEKADNAYLFNLFSRNLAEALRQEIWLSDTLVKKLNELFKLFITISYEYDELYLGKPQEFKKNALVEVGHNHHDEVVALREEIKSIFYSDMISLHEVEVFLKTKEQRKFSIN